MGSNWKGVGLLLLSLSSVLDPVAAVKRENFKTCEQSGFCKRNRDYADAVSAQGTSFKSPYILDSKTLKTTDSTITATIRKQTEQNGASVDLPLVISVLENGAARVQIDEEKRLKKEIELRHGSQARKERYNEAGSWALNGEPALGKISNTASTDKSVTVTYGPSGNFEAVVTFSPFQIEFVRDKQVHIKLNSENLLNYEHWRPKIEKEEPKEGEEPKAEDTQGPDESTWWDETFGGATDSKPRGPESIGLDIVFPGYQHVFGIPGHTGPLSLKETRGGDGKYDQPYRLYNSDVFEYEMDSPMTLYGAIPFMQAHRKGSTVGVFWLNAAETWIDIVKGSKKSTDTKTHWFSEAGVLDVFIMLGPTPQSVIGTYGDLTGTTQLPQEHAISYHQCRWNYVSDEDVKDVDRKFDRSDIPYDVIWLDIEYTEGKKYFTWDPDTFPNPLDMGKQLDEHQRKLVVIIDPHIKNEGNYHVVDELKSKDLAVHNKDNNLYEGWCWPGSSHWIDCFNPAAIKWWTGLFDFSKFKGTMKNTWIWNDMNEPSVFNGPETTMPKDNLHFGNWEHRDVHNLNGMTFVNATYQALLARESPAKRPFILTRSYYSGTQRLGAMWTGDNQANWDHLRASFPMILQQGISGFPFAGADVGGFFGNPSKELLTRWYQTGAFYPYFRAHAHIDTRRREPYLAGAPYTDIITQALRLRYALMPVWYTAFHEAHVASSPIVRPQYFVHPDDDKGFSIDDQLYIGSSGLLAKPVQHEGAEHVDIYLADAKTYYDYWDFTSYAGGQKTHKVNAPLDTIPLLMQGGNIFPRRDRARRSSGLMKYDPYTLVVVLDESGNAKGQLYNDDGESFDYEQGASVWRSFEYKAETKKLTSVDIGTSGKKTAAYLKKIDSVKVGKVIVVAAPDSWKSKTEVQAKQDGKTHASTLQYTAAENGKAAWAVVRHPDVKIGADWEIDFS